MPTWAGHPTYVRERERLVEYLRSPNYRFRRTDPVIFLCGGAGSKNRDTLRDYLAKHSSSLSLFYAEKVWDQIASQVAHGALKMESDLAALADLVLIIVESPGTFAELGAFSIGDTLRKKLLPIVDEEYRTRQSFISTGPLRWIDEDSEFRPTIYVPLPQILLAIDEIQDRISRIPPARSISITDLASSPKHLLFFLCDLISVIYPATMRMVEDYVNLISPSIFSGAISVPTLLGLAVTMGLLRVQKFEPTSEAFLLPWSPNAIERPYHHKRLLDLPSQRAAHVGVLLSIREARNVLTAYSRSIW